MLNTERRVAALEASASDISLKIILVDDGETQAEGLERIGLSPKALRVLSIAPLDALL